MISLILVVVFALIGVDADENERRLYKELLAGYNPLERPVYNHSMAVEVKLRMVLAQIVDVDEKNQIIQINIWMNYEWYDHNLIWVPADYNNVTDIRLPVGSIWKPDVLLYNSVDSNFDGTYQSNHVVNFDGLVNWVPPGIVKSRCNINIKWFPFDDQSCFLKFGSWTYHDGKLNLSFGSFSRPLDNSSDSDKAWDTSEYQENGEWKLLETTVNRSHRKYDCCPEVYSDIKYNFTIRRRTLYYGFNMIIPSLLVSMMTLLGFALPVESGEKITLEITILLSVCVFLGMVASMTPPTSEALPLIGIYFCCNMILVALSVVFSVIVLNLHYRTPDTHTMSHRVRNVMLNWLPWLLMMKRPGHKLSRRSLLSRSKSSDQSFSDEEKTSFGFGVVESESLMRNVRCSEEGEEMNGWTKADPNTYNNGIRRAARKYSDDLETRLMSCLRMAASNPQLMDLGVQTMLLTMQQIYTELRFISQRMMREDEIQDTKNDWRFAAMVVDRLCFVVFSLFIILSTCVIFFSAPHLIA